MSVEVVGIRHQSPACARLVRRLIAERRPQAVLIEGPSDFNARIDELLLAHRLPVALYSYANDGERAAQCWFPFLDYSPEWIALHSGRACGAQLRFIDLPHWKYRAVPEEKRRQAEGVSRYALSAERLRHNFGCDSNTALWDHLFESAPEAELQDRLNLYFHELRGDDQGSAEDQAREERMAQWVAWADRQHGSGLVLVICGGWHKRAIEQRWPRLSGDVEPPGEASSDPRIACSYLVPYEFRQVDALGGYGAGMQSPLYYQWAWEVGLGAAAREATQGIVRRLRRKGVPLSTADLMAFETMLQGLCRLRGHAEPLRADILDALQSSVIKEALDAPPPWAEERILHSRHHPLLREILLSLTGEGGGQLHADTPLPPLLDDVKQQLAACGIEPRRQGTQLVCDRRRTEDASKAAVLWRLVLIGLGGVELQATRAPNAARSLRAELHYEEQWRVTANERWLPDLIEAAAYGATLESAARARLLERAHESAGDAAACATLLLQAMRAGLADVGADLAQRLEQESAALHDHAELAQATLTLVAVAHAGFWGNDVAALFEQAVGMMAERLLWLLEERQGNLVEHIEGDISAVEVFERLLQQYAATPNRQSVLDTLQRIAGDIAKAPALRGASLAVCYLHGALGDNANARLLAAVQAVPPRTELGDFLYGLFSRARSAAVESDGIVEAVHGALESMSGEEFLAALPQLRSAFSWFPPRERGAIAARVGAMLGLSTMEQRRLLQQGSTALADAKRIEAQALAWAAELKVPS
jgi:hypothetical protein